MREQHAQDPRQTLKVRSLKRLRFETSEQKDAQSSTDAWQTQNYKTL
jgi:hypothetical protein